MNLKSTPTLDAMVDDGFRETTIEIAPKCKLYQRQNEKIIYDTQTDRIVCTYKSEEYLEEKVKFYSK